METVAKMEWAGIATVLGKDPSSGEFTKADFLLAAE